FLLKEFVKRFAKGVVLDMGTGSGLQAREASHSARTSKVFAVDIDKEAIAYCKKYNDHKRHKKVKWLVGDLFSPVKNKFDTVIFNPPYLPQDHKTRDIALEGGKKGNEVIARFLDEVNDYLKPDGIILLVFSSLTPGVKEILDRNMLVGRELGRTHMFFEDIFVYLIKKNPILKKLERKGVSQIKFLARGKRGVVFTGKLKGKKVAVKVKRPSSTAVGTISHEAKMLKFLNRHKIGPKYLFHSSLFLVYVFVEGVYLRDLIKSKKLKSVCKKVFEQCFVLDSLKVNKQEMTRPYKHVIVKGDKVTLIDFERARRTDSPHNVTQFCTFVMNHVDKDKAKWIKLARMYSKTPSKAVFRLIVRSL
ncbi:methyltransferase, partial [Candidatus Woesearchaeota archaeon]|nr:methyltransferase [Candidatus Woesearchaeota archaeon]